MGVNGLWQVLQPCARPTNLATLNRKRLAVDASIWIYQFLKAVRDKEGNALRNSHVVGFFRRICKLLWFGIRPVFVFDGGAPALKRATLQGRRRRREGRREDAVRTAGKLLAVQMQRIAEEEDDRRKQRVAQPETEEPGEALPEMENIVYADEAFSSKQERQKNRKFYKQDQYHLPELENGIEAMGKPEDPRIMSVEELEEYARQFHNGEDINLYDFSKIDFDGDFFKSLPPPDRYNILNAARIRSRLRMGLSKEQLDDMFPDRMAFSRFQIERVKERNHLTQRLMFEMNMAGTDLTMNGGGRIAGDKNREYILVKNDGVEGGWALGVVSTEKDRGTYQKPIDVDALQFQYQTKEEDQELEEDDDFEDVPIEGLNRLPKLKSGATRPAPDAAADQVEDSMFIDGEPAQDLFGSPRQEDQLQADEDEDLNRAIAMSLRTQHGVRDQAEVDEDEEFEDVPMPEWTQKAVDTPKPITSSSGRMVAHIVNNRANAAVPRRRESSASSDSDVDLRTALATARKQKKPQPPPKAPVKPNVKNPFDGPLPFEKLNWKTSFFEKKPAEKPKDTDKTSEAGGFEIESDNEDLEGGFEKEPVENAPRPVPPWMINDDVDIRDSLKQQQEIEKEINEEDQELVMEERRQWQKKQRNEVVEIDSSDDSDSDVEIVEAPAQALDLQENTAGSPSPSRSALAEMSAEEVGTEDAEKQQSAVLEITQSKSPQEDIQARSSSPEMEFEDVDVPEQSLMEEAPSLQQDDSLEMDFEDVTAPTPPIVQQERVEGIAAAAADDDDLFADVEYDEFSDPEEEELLVQMAEEAEEHARFASQLNNKPERQNQEDYERELRALRSQQKKDRRDADEVTQIMVTECQSLLRLFGIPYVTAPMEAEAQCAELVQLGLVDGIVTDDSDTFLFGGTRVYKNMFNSNKFVECYLSSDLEKELSLSREELISIAQLLGSDYTEGLPGIGPVTAVEILSEFPGKDGLKEFRDWWQDVQAQTRPKEADASSPFRRKFRKSQAKKLFLPPGFPNPAVFEAYLNPETDKNPEQFQWGVPNLEGLRQFLMATIGWSQERTDEVLVPVIKDMNRREVEGTQSNITRYFEGGVGVGAKESFAPRQRVKGSKRMAEAVSKLRAKTGADSSVDETVPSDAGDPTRKRKARATAVIEDEEEDNVAGYDADLGNDSTAKIPRGKGRGKMAKV